MRNWMKKEIDILGYPYDMASSTMGARLGPESIRIAGLINGLRDIGYKVNDHGDIKLSNAYNLDDSDNVLKNFNLTLDAAKTMIPEISNIYKRGNFPLILGGDHSLVLSSGKALLENFDNPGIIYIDAHADINTEETTPTGNIHGMPLSFLCGEGPDEFKNVGNEIRLKPENIVYIGLRDVDPGEQKILADMGIKAYSMEDIDEFGITDVVKEAISYITERADNIHLSFDIDCLDPEVAPGTGVKVPGGITFREAKTALTLLSEVKKLVSAEFVEVNPLLDDENLTAEIAVMLIMRLFGKMQLQYKENYQKIQGYEGF